MVSNQFARTIGLIGQDSFDKLQEATVLVVGLGGVGSYALEGIVRSGVGKVIIVDSDTIEESNLNRQLETDVFNIGKDKVTACKERMLKINPNVNVVDKKMFVSKDNLKEIFAEKIDYVIDAIDSVDSKIALYQYCQEHDIDIISSLGMAKRLDPTKVVITKLKKTENDPLAKAIRHKARLANLSLDVDVVVSLETPKETEGLGSMMFVPACAGLSCAYYVVDKIIKKE